MKAIKSCIFAANLTLSFLEVRKNKRGKDNQLQESQGLLRTNQCSRGAPLSLCPKKFYSVPSIEKYPA